MGVALDPRLRVLLKADLPKHALPDGLYLAVGENPASLPPTYAARVVHLEQLVPTLRWKRSGPQIDREARSTCLWEERNLTAMVGTGEKSMPYKEPYNETGDVQLGNPKKQLVCKQFTKRLDGTEDTTVRLFLVYRKEEASSSRVRKRRKTAGVQQTGAGAGGSSAVEKELQHTAESECELYAILSIDPEHFSDDDLQDQNLFQDKLEQIKKQVNEALSKVSESNPERGAVFKQVADQVSTG
jgi:hypothetical protein